MSHPCPLLEINQLTLPHLNIQHFAFNSGECWVILGRNGSGKQHLATLFEGKPDLPAQQFTHQFKHIHVLSFEAQQRFYEQELQNDDSEFMEGADEGSTVAQLLGINGSIPQELEFLGLAPLLDRGYKLLSSGESRKALLAEALLQKPDLLILDEPFDSLDLNSRKQLADFLCHLQQAGNTSLIFLLNNVDDIFPWHTHLAVLEQGELILSGTVAQMQGNHELAALLAFNPANLPPWPAELPRAQRSGALVALNNGKVAYGDTVIFEHLNVLVNEGDHTLVTGANGAGKSTLLGLICGDHPQCYSNDLTVLGMKRGSGETIWELKRNIGIVSSSLHRDHRVPGSALHIVLSGFHDTIGLYDAVSREQTEHARHWLALVGLATKTQIAFRQLSYGEQRLVLIARALVKQPAILILDEPTLGLDSVNRLRVMYFLEHLSTQHRTTILMASHRLDEHLPLFCKHVQLG